MQKKWANSVLKILEKLDACTSEVSTFVGEKYKYKYKFIFLVQNSTINLYFLCVIVRYLKDEDRSRLVQNLVHIICHQLDVPDNTTEMNLKTVLPWILLHSILQ